MDRRAAVTAMCRLLAPSMSATRPQLSQFLLAYMMETNFVTRSAYDIRSLGNNSHGVYPDRPSDGLFYKLRLRSFATLHSNKSGTNTNSELPVDGVSLHRYLIAGLHIRERRRCLGFLQSLTPPDCKHAAKNDYLIVRLADRDRPSDEAPTTEEVVIPPGPMRLCLRGTGFPMFQRVIWAELDNWANDWRESLDFLDRKFAFQVLVPNVYFMCMEVLLYIPPIHCLLTIRCYRSLT